MNRTVQQYNQQNLISIQNFHAMCSVQFLLSCWTSQRVPTLRRLRTCEAIFLHISSVSWYSVSVRVTTIVSLIKWPIRFSPNSRFSVYSFFLWKSGIRLQRIRKTKEAVDTYLLPKHWQFEKVLPCVPLVKLICQSQCQVNKKKFDLSETRIFIVRTVHAMQCETRQAESALVWTLYDTGKNLQQPDPTWRHWPHWRSGRRKPAWRVQPLQLQCS